MTTMLIYNAYNGSNGYNAYITMPTMTYNEEKFIAAIVGIVAIVAPDNSQMTHQSSPTGIENSTTPVVRDSDIFRGLSLRLWSQLFCCPFNLRWLLLTFRSPSCVLRSWSRVVLLLLFRVALVDHSLT